MTKKLSSWTSNQPLAAIDKELITMKLISVKGDKQNQFKNQEKVKVDSPMSTNLDASSLISTDEQNKALASEKSSLKDVSETSKRTHKHKHKHHHCHRHHRHHHHNHGHRVTKTIQQPRIVYSKASQNNGHTKTSANIPNGTNNQPTIADDHKESIVTDSQSQAKKSSKGNVPLQSIENKFVSQRAAPTDETQVGNCSSLFYSQPTSSCVCTSGPQQIEQIVYTDDCCIPSSTVNCASTCCTLQQPETICCLPQQSQSICCLPQQSQSICCLPQQAETICCLPQQQQQQQQLFLCTDTTPSPPLLCVPKPSANLFIQQQQPVAQAQSIQIIQAPQAQQAQYLQISSTTPQIIQTLQAPSAQYLQISSSTPQIIQTIQVPGVQNLQAQQVIQAFQVPAQAAAVSPQILYQRPYDPIVIPVQNQQLAITQAPVVALSQPSYAPARLLGATSARPGLQGPRMFQHALVRTVAGRTGVPLPPSGIGGLPLLSPPASFYSPTRGAALASTARALINGGAQPSTSSLPIKPLTAGGMLIPFQPSDSSTGMASGTRPRSNLRNFDNVQRQIEQRGQLLAEIQRQMSHRTPSLPVHSPNRVNLPSPYARNLSGSRPGYTPNVPISSPLFSSSIPQSPSAISTNFPQSSPIIRSQTPYTGGNAFDTSSSSSSSKSSASSILPTPRTSAAPSNLFYSGPSSMNIRGDSIISGPSAPYQSLRP